MKEVVDLLEKTDPPLPEAFPEHPILQDYSGFRSSFRIIAKQNSINKTEHLFCVNGDFDVFHTIVPDPTYAEELAKYRQRTGHNPLPSSSSRT